MQSSRLSSQKKFKNHALKQKFYRENLNLRIILLTCVCFEKYRNCVLGFQRNCCVIALIVFFWKNFKANFEFLRWKSFQNRLANGKQTITTKKILFQKIFLVHFDKKI